MFSKGLKWGAHMLDFLSKSIWTVQVKVWLVPCDVKVTVYYGFMYIRIVKHELTREWWDGGGFPFPLQLGLSEVFSASLFLKRLTCKATRRLFLAAVVHSWPLISRGPPTIRHQVEAPGGRMGSSAWRGFSELLEQRKLDKMIRKRQSKFTGPVMKSYRTW